MTVAGRFASRTALFWMDTKPAGTGHVVVLLLAQLVPDWLARGAPRVLNRIPAEPVESLKAIVLLMTFTFGESVSEIPAPSQPATLSTMMLLVTSAEFHWPGSVGKATISEPLTALNEMPPPVPLSAAFPMMRLALM